MAFLRMAALVATLAAVPLTLWGTYKLLGNFGDCLFGEEKEPMAPLSPPNLKASAGDGDARLTWSVPSDQLRLVEQWEYEQSRAGTVPGRHSTGSSATSYLVHGLTNGETYSFRVRAILKPGTGKVANWSNVISATPMQAGDVLERMERHQRGMEQHQWSMARQQEEMARQQGRIADSASAVAAFLAENAKAFRQLVDRGVRALETLAESSKGANQELADIRGELGDVAVNIGEVGDELAAGLSGIEEQLGGSPAEPEKMPDVCGGQGIAEKPWLTLTFDNNSFNVDSGTNNLKEIQRFAKKLNELDGGLILTVGRTTAIGEDAYNLQLSDRRATCASLCIRKHLGERAEKFKFREVAKGETIMPPDLPGTSPDSRRVDVTVCPGVDNGAKEGSGDVSDLTLDVCGCESMSLRESGAEREA